MIENSDNLRLETFCDGVFAIAATLLIIDIKLPSTAQISTTIDFWHALEHITPSLFAFVLSFIVIFITWVNHHNCLKLLNKSSSPFLYSNGLLLISVIFIPFPTSLMGEYLLTDHSSPAVILYDLTLAVQAIGWILLTTAILKNHLTKNEESKLYIKRNNTYGYFAFGLYSLCSVLAFWFPVTIAIITTFSWIFWLVFGIRIKHGGTNN